MAQEQPLKISEIVSAINGAADSIDSEDPIKAKKAAFILNDNKIPESEWQDLTWAVRNARNIENDDETLKTAVRIKNKVFNEVQKNTYTMGAFKPYEVKGTGPTKAERMLGTYIPSKDLKNYLMNRGYETQEDPSGRILIRKPNELKWSEFNPKGEGALDFDAMDFIDKAPDVAEAILTAGTVVNPLIGIPLQAAYGAGSEATRQYVSQQVGGRFKGEWDVADIAVAGGLSGLLGAGADLVGAVAKRAGPAMKEIAKTKDATRKAAPLMEQAGDILGIKFTKEELAKSPEQRKLFDAVNRSSESIVGYFTGESAQRKMMGDRQEVLDAVKEAILEDMSQRVSGMSAEKLKKASAQRLKWEAGKDVQKQITDNISAKKEASQFFYDRISKIMGKKDFDADPGIFYTKMTKLKELGKGSNEVDKAIDPVIKKFDSLLLEDGTITAATIKNMRSDALSASREAMQAGNGQKSRINGEIADILKEIEDDSISRAITRFEKGAEKEFRINAQEAAKYANKNIEPVASALFPPNRNIQKIELTNQMKKDLESARRLWREANQDATMVWEKTGGKWSADLGPKLQEMKGAPAEEFLKRVSPDKGDYEKLVNMRKNYPKMFARAQKANKIEEVQDILGKIAATQERGKAEWSKTVQELLKLRNEELSVVLGKDSREKLKALQTAYKYAPELINASGTKINENLMTGALTADSVEAYKRWLLKTAYSVGNAEKLAKAFSMYTTPVKQTIKGAGQAYISREGDQ